MPVVFCGINDIKNYSFDPANNFAGISEDVDIASTLSIALKLHPETTQVALVSDATETE